MGKLPPLNKLSIKSIFHGRYLLAIVAGLMFGLAFPKFDLAGLIWFGPAFVLLLAAGQGKGVIFRVGFVAGLAFYLLSLDWLLNIPVTFFPILGWAALSAYLALYVGLWARLCWWFFPVSLANEPGASFRNVAEVFLQTTLVQRARWAFLCAVIWVAIEMFVGRFLTGFPWLQLGISQFKLLPLIQIASVTGVYGVSFLIVWLSVSLVSAVMVMTNRPAQQWRWAVEISLPLSVMILVVAGGFKIVAFEKPTTDRVLKVTMVQPSIPQQIKWDERENKKAFEKVLTLSAQALATKPDLLIWPEAATPGYVRYDKEVGDRVIQLAATNKLWFILGADDIEPHKGSSDPKEADYFNSAFLVSPTGQLANKYDKRKLVAFGEYIPLIKWLPFIKYLTPIDGGFTPGEKTVAFEMTNPHAIISPIICFEDVFATVARESVREDTDFLLNLTNDGWFGEGGAQWQQAAHGVFRAVENHVPLVRSTNNGLTCWIDPQGRMYEVYYGNSTDIYGAGFKTARVPLLAPGERRSLTFYTRHGDVFGWGCVLASVLGVVWRKRLAAKKA